MLNAWNIIEMYDKGALTEMHTVSLLVENVNAEEFLELPEEWRIKVLAELDRLPRTDEGWERMVFSGEVSQTEARRRWKERVSSLREQLDNIRQSDKYSHENVSPMAT